MTSSKVSSSRPRRKAMAVLAAGLVLTSLAGVPPADAKVGGGSSSGSRGNRTFSAPPSTSTAPSAAQPMQRTEAPASARNPGMQAAPQAAPAKPRGFLGSLGTGLMAGMLGAGLFGLLSGSGFLGGLGSLSSMFGLLFQVALIGGLIWLAMRFFRSRSQPAFAGAPAGAPMSGPAPGPSAYARTGMMGGGNGATPQPGPSDTINIGPADYAAFEKTLVDIQGAYSREDAQALSRLATDEMVRMFGADIEENRRRNVRNEVGGAKLLQGDLAEAWREGPSEYATVAMRFSVMDTMVDRTSGRVVSGDATRPSESTELWTFRREQPASWRLSAIQQTA